MKKIDTKSKFIKSEKKTLFIFFFSCIVARDRHICFKGHADLIT